MFNIPSIWMAVAGAVLFGLVVWKAYDIGKDGAEAACAAKIEKIKNDIQKEYIKEMERLQEANDAAKKQQEKLAEELSQKEDALDSLLLQLEEDAKNDPEAGSCGINEGAVDRLNQIQ